jgi:hypothetical protein
MQIKRCDLFTNLRTEGAVLPADPSPADVIASKDWATGEDRAGTAPHPSSFNPHPSTCWLERRSGTGQQTGTRALDTLCQGVQDAIVALGRGFLAHPANAALREKLRRGATDGGLSAQDYYRQILRMVYRLLFLFVAEDRGLLLVPDADPSTQERFIHFYSTARLRRSAGRQRDTRHSDLFQSFVLVMQRLGHVDGCPELGLPALGGFLWSDRATPDLTGSWKSRAERRESGEASGEPRVGRGESHSPPPPIPDSRFPTPSKIADSDFLAAIRALAYTIDGNVPRAVDYRNLGAETFGSVYESLLQLQPKIDVDAGTFELDLGAGHERKTTGSYYTPASLINCLLDSALDPVVDDRLKDADRLAAGEWATEAEQHEALQIVCRTPWDGSPARPSDSVPESAPAELTTETTAAAIAARMPEWIKTPPAVRYARLAERALLNLKICDPACGTGHFLIAAARRLAKRLAAVRAADQQPAPGAVRHAMRDVISRCVYGVDINPMAVEVCKISLWLESLEPGKPLRFLDHHIQCGNSLLGATPALLAKGIPDDAFKPIEGDDKTVCSQLKKKNKRQRQDDVSGKGDPFDPPRICGNLAAQFANLAAAGEDMARDVATKEARYARLIGSADYRAARLVADTCCAVFVWKKDDTDLGRRCPTERQFRNIERHPNNIHPRVREGIVRLREQHQFFHWHLAFPDVFRLPAGEDEPENRATGWSGGFDVILGNPPFVNVIEGGVSLPVKKMLATLSDELGGTADLAHHFVNQCDRVTQRNGRIGLVQPKTFLNADAAAGLRETLRQRRPPAVLYVPRTATFFEDASAYVCLIVLGTDCECAVSEADDLECAVWSRGPILHGNWWRSFQSILGNLANFEVGECRALGAHFEVQASMTTADAYAIKPHVTDDRNGVGLKLVTTGLIDPFLCKWGETRCRYLGLDLVCPRIASDSAFPAALQRRLRNARRPKLLLAGLCDRIEAFLDGEGQYVGAVSTFSVFHPTDSVNALSRLCEWLNSPQATSLIRAELGAASVGGHYMTIKKKTLQTLPIPISGL